MKFYTEILYEILVYDFVCGFFDKFFLLGEGEREKGFSALD